LKVSGFNFFTRFLLLFCCFCIYICIRENGKEESKYTIREEIFANIFHLLLGGRTLGVKFFLIEFLFVKDGMKRSGKDDPGRSFSFQTFLTP